MTQHENITINHEDIKQWVSDRGCIPVQVKGTGSNEDAGLLRIDFVKGDEKDGRLEEISWDEWFQKFDEKRLAFLHQDKTADGKESRFFKLVSRE